MIFFKYLDSWMDRWNSFNEIIVLNSRESFWKSVDRVYRIYIVFALYIVRIENRNYIFFFFWTYSNTILKDTLDIEFNYDLCNSKVQL